MWREKREVNEGEEGISWWVEGREKFGRDRREKLASQRKRLAGRGERKESEKEEERGD